MNFFKKKNKADTSGNNQNSRRNFIAGSAGTILGLGLLGGAASAFAGSKSKTGYIYVKQNGEIINDYVPQGGAQPYVGSIMMNGYNFAPVGWLACNGQLVSIAEYETLFVLLGTTYGGNGVSNFGLPDLRGRIPLHQGAGPGLSTYVIGQTGGTEEVTLGINQIPAHNHSILVSAFSGTVASPTGGFVAQNADGIGSYASAVDTNLNFGSMQITGGSQPHNNTQPFLCINFCIAVQGIFPFQG